MSSAPLPHVKSFISWEGVESTMTGPTARNDTKVTQSFGISLMSKTPGKGGLGTWSLLIHVYTKHFFTKKAVDSKKIFE